MLIVLMGSRILANHAVAGSRKLFPPARQLLRDFLRSRCAGQISFRHRAFQIEHAQRVAAKSFVHGLQFRERQLVQRFADFFRQRHDRADDVMRLPEWHSFFHEIIREVGRQQRRVARGGGAGGAG